MCALEQEQTKLAYQDQARVFYFYAYRIYKMKELLKCSICFDVFQKPVGVSNCTHIFCDDCIRTYMEYSSKRAPPCPICQKPILRESLHAHDYLELVANFVFNATGQINSILGSSSNELPPFQNMVTLVKDNPILKEMFSKPNTANKPTPPPDLSLILKARKVLVGPSNKIISGTEELNLPQSVNRIANLCTSSNHRVKSTANAFKDPFDKLKGAPVQNPLFKNNRINFNTRCYSKQKCVNQNTREKNKRYVDKVREFESNANKNDIIRWLNNSSNAFDVISQSQDRNVSHTQLSEFDMPSVSQLHACKHKPAPPISQINRQKHEQDRIRRKTDKIIHLSRSDFPKNKCLTQSSNKRTRSLECQVKTVGPKLRLKRHSIAVCESPEEKFNIEQVNSEEEVIFAGAFQVGRQAVVDMMEEEYLKVIDNEILNKPSTSAKPLQKPAKLLDSPKRSKRISSKLLKTIEEANKRIKSSMDTSSGWTRMNEIKKTIRKTEKKPDKLTVVSRHSSLENLTNTMAENIDKNHQNSGKGKKTTPSKNTEAIVVIERVKVSSFTGIKKSAEDKAQVYDLDALESYFSKNLNQESTLSHNRSMEDTSKIEAKKKKLPNQTDNASKSRKKNSPLQILQNKEGGRAPLPVSISCKEKEILERKDDKPKPSVDRASKRKKSLASSRITSDTSNKIKRGSSVTTARTRSLSALNRICKLDISNETSTSKSSNNIIAKTTRSASVEKKNLHEKKETAKASNETKNMNRSESESVAFSDADTSNLKVLKNGVKAKKKLFTPNFADRDEVEIVGPNENNLRNPEPPLGSALKNPAKLGAIDLENISNECTTAYKSKQTTDSSKKNDKSILPASSQGSDLKTSEKESSQQHIHHDEDDDVFGKPTQVINACDFNDEKIEVNDDEDDIFKIPTQMIVMRNSEGTEESSENKLKTIMKQKIQLLNNILNTFDDKHDAKQPLSNMVSSVKTVLVDIDQTLNMLSTSDSKNDEFPAKLHHQMSHSLELMQSVYIQTDNVNEMSSLFSHSITTQTEFARHAHKDAAMQTDTLDSSRGFRISSTAMFNLQAVVDGQTQTDAMMCPKCSYSFLENKMTSDMLQRDTNTSKSLTDKCSLSASFDHISFETQDIIKGKQIESTITSIKSSTLNTQKYIGAGASDKRSQNECIDNNRKDLKGPILLEKSQQVCTADVIPRPSANKKTFKRIRRASSGSDSDREVLPRDVKRNKYMQQDVSLHFLSEPPNEVSQTNPRVAQGDGFALSEGSQDINYAEFLDKVLKKCDDEQTKMRPPKPPLEKPVEPPVKRFKTQDIIKECEMIIKEACSDTIRIENTENYSNNFNNVTRRNLQEPTKLTLAALENEFQYGFSGNVKGSGNDANKVSKSTDLEISYEMELTPNVQGQGINNSKTYKDKFSESLFASADNFDKNAGTHRNRNNTEPVETLMGENQVTKRCLDELINQFNELDDSFEDDVNAEVESINESILHNRSSTAFVTNKGNVNSKTGNSATDKINILQNIVINQGHHLPETNEALMDLNVSIGDNASVKSDEMFESDVEVVETTPQKNRPAALEKLSFLSQAYYNPDEKMVLPPLAGESPVVISSCDSPPPHCLNQTFTPPPEFQDFANTGATSNKNDEIIAKEKLDTIHIGTGRNAPSLSSLTPDLLLPVIIDERNKKESLITSTPYTQGSQIMSVRTLNLSPIHGKQPNQRSNPIIAAQTCKFSPLTIVKSKTPPPQRMVPLNTSTPKQKSILSYVRPTESPSTSHLSQASQRSVHNLSAINKKPCAACTRMNKEQLLAITALSTKKLISYSNTYSASVTHMVVAVNEHQWVKDHTMKFVSAVASGIWVVSFNWIEECLKQSRVLPEEPFEALDVSGVDGPKQSRLTRTVNPLLQGYVVHVATPFVSTTQKEVENVILLLGGEVVPRPDDLLSSNGKVRLIITEARGTQDFELYEMWLETLQVVTVDLEWLSRSVGQYQKLSLRPFILCSDDSLCNLGYPSQLIVEVPYSFSHNTLSTV